METATGALPVRLAAFAHEPLDARSACIAVTDAAGDARQAVSDLRDLGAPVVFVARDERVEWWVQRATEPPDRRQTLALPELARFFDERKQQFSAASLYRAKTLGRLTREYQLDFVDQGLMPLVEQRAGDRLAEFIETVIAGLHARLGRKGAAGFDPWFFRAAFWLLAGKLLKDKQVPAFADLDLTRVDVVLRAVARHYNAAAFEVRGAAEREALHEAASTTARLGSLHHVTTEALALVYESSLVDAATREALGVHSTPPYLVDYIVWRLEPWIRKIPEDQRHVFEPAAGHAGFLVAAMRVLRDLLPASRTSEFRRTYLRNHLHGMEIDGFALEVARLSLTLADVPHPDGWDLRQQDMFEGQSLGRRAADSMIVLSNPPYEAFTAEERARYERRGRAPLRTLKSTEMLARLLPSLRPGALCGLVLPQSVLDGKDAQGVRQTLVGEFDLFEVCELPDKVFRHSDAETAVVLARRREVGVTRGRTRYRKVRERDLSRFRQTYEATFDSLVAQEQFVERSAATLRVSELDEVWRGCDGLLTLDTIADVGQGFSHESPKTLPSDVVLTSPKRLPGFVQGYVRLDPGDIHIHEEPRLLWLNLDEKLIGRRRSGAKHGIPQVLLNYAPVGRGRWRLKAFIDAHGRPFMSRFLCVRPKNRWPLEFLWALLNSPFANAFVSDRSGKRDILKGVVEQLPVPPVTDDDDDLQRVARLAREYLDVASGARAPLFDRAADPTSLRDLLLQIDAEILALYDLPPRLERRLLDVFAGERRVGVPFEQVRYYPEGFEPWIPLKIYLSEPYRRSTAETLLERSREAAPPTVVAALRRAVEAFSD